MTTERSKAMDDLARSVERATASSQLEQNDSGEPEKYPYGGSMYHHYWAILNGEWVVMRRPADATHLPNFLHNVRMNPPEGVEPPKAERWDPNG